MQKYCGDSIEILSRFNGKVTEILWQFHYNCMEIDTYGIYMDGIPTSIVIEINPFVKTIWIVQEIDNL